MQARIREGEPNRKGPRFAIVMSRFDTTVTGELVEGALQRDCKGGDDEGYSAALAAVEMASPCQHLDADAAPAGLR